MFAMHIREYLHPGEWSGSFFGDQLIVDLLDSGIEAWSIQNNTKRVVRVKPVYGEFVTYAPIDETYKVEKFDDAEHCRKQFAKDVAAFEYLEIESHSKLNAPFWITDVQDSQIFYHQLNIRFLLTGVVDYPDVQSSIAFSQRSEESLKKLLTDKWIRQGKSEPNLSVIKRHVAENMRLSEIDLIACETSHSKVVLRLVRELDNQVYEAQAEVCGTAPLRVGDKLSRYTKDTNDNVWSATIAEVVSIH